MFKNIILKVTKIQKFVVAYLEKQCGEFENLNLIKKIRIKLSLQCLD